MRLYSKERSDHTPAEEEKAIMLESMEDTYDASADIEKALSYEDIIRLFGAAGDLSGSSGDEIPAGLLGEGYLSEARHFRKMRSMYAFPRPRDASGDYGKGGAASMTEKELDAFMSKVLLDAIAFDEDRL